ncbi:MAG: type 3 dihydrofolate reductase, partial [Candidatus Competibacter sp.]
MMPTPASNACAADDEPRVAVTANSDRPPPLALIAALARNRVIGRNNALPWHLPADLRFFKQTTMGKPLLLGRRTWESIGRPLPGRRMIVLTGDPTYRAEGCAVAHSLREALSLLGAASEIMVIGGAGLFEQTLPLAERMYLTRVEAEIPGDVWFPEWDARQWRLAWEEAHPADGKHAWPFRFQRWERRCDERSENPVA